MRITPAISITAALLLVGVCSPVALAQSQVKTEKTIEEVVVTARMRGESDLSVPVTISALSSEDIENAAIDSFADLSSIVPSLSVSEVSGGLGGAIILRGVGTSAGSNASFEQTVSVNIDGVQLSRGTALRIAQLDMQQIEVLRGPQALFFGKNSPAGAISITTQDPTDELESMVRMGHEFNANQSLVDLMISGPLSDTLGGRIMLNGSRMDGWMENHAGDVDAAANALVPGAVNARVDEGPESDFVFGRATLLWEPSEVFRLRSKLSYAEQEGPGFQQGPNQRIYCPQGNSQVASQVNSLSGDPVIRAALTPLLSNSDCKADDNYSHGSINPDHLVNSDLGKDEKGLGQYQLGLASVEANWYISSNLSLTAITGYADIEEKRYDTYSYNPASAIAGLNFGGTTTWEQLSQEVRLSSDYNSGVNFTLGGFVESTELNTYTQEFATPGPRFDHKIEGSTLSLFASALYEITDTVELSGGARWTKEKRELSVNRNNIAQPLDPEDATFNNTSPELTLTWRPNEDLTLFASYREGFKSGGFGTPNINQAAFMSPQDFLFEPESVDGFELGMHALALDGQLRMNAAIYDYNYQNLQINSLDNSSGIPVIRINNAAEASVQGVEFDFLYEPQQLAGLTFNGAVNYSGSEFEKFDASCYIGQTIAEGCNLGLDTATGNYKAQSLAGESLPSNSEWSGSLGVAFSTQLGNSPLRYRIASDLSYRSSYNPHPELAPGAEQDSVTYINGSIKLFAEDSRWEVELIARNLTNEFRAQSSSNAPTTGTGSLTGSTTDGGLADLVGYVNRGREVLLRVTFRPNLF